MKHFPRTAALAAGMSLVLALAACQPEGDKAADAGAATASEGEAATLQIKGLETAQEEVSYMIGRDIARSLEEIEGEIDVDTLVASLKGGLAGEESKMTEEQTAQLRESFAQRIQAERIAQMMADATANREAGEKFLAGNSEKEGVEVTESGLQYQVLEAGEGARPEADDTVRVHYKGTLLDGETFDSSYDRGEPAVFALPQVVPGWQEGLTLMPVGSKYRFWIPGELGYGEVGTPGGPIGPNETLVFEVELLDIVETPAR